MSQPESPKEDGPSAPDAWEAHYTGENTPWDLGQPNPALVQALDQAHGLGLARPASPGDAWAIVPGCGRGHDGIPLLKAGFGVVGVDFAPSAAEAARGRWARFGSRGEVRVADVTLLPADLDGRFDLALEHTCFVALHPSLRAAYVANLARVVRPGGYLVGILFTGPREGGPPYSVAPEAARALLAEDFEILHFEAATGSVAQRVALAEWALIARRRAPRSRP